MRRAMTRSGGARRGRACGGGSPARSRGAALALLLALTSCASPSERFAARAQELGVELDTVRGTRFLHRVAVRSGAGTAHARRLHVYLGGDASPRAALRFRPADPTPGEPLALELMLRDPAPGLHLGRPCQHALERCEPLHWTQGRYAEEIVDSLCTALGRWLDEQPGGGPEELVLIGWSGGGTLAVLMAERMAARGVRAVVTVAANLDVAAWTAHHGYRAFDASLDPARDAPRPRVAELHLFGGRDRVVPPALGLAAAHARPGAHARVVPGASHASGWLEAWPEALAELDALLAERRTSRRAREP